jgi:LuxR family maltose regulon positive regulatory protein
MIIIESKLSVPDLSPYLIRERLFDFIDHHLHCSLICVSGASGYGKTTLLSSYLLEKQKEAVWYRLTHQDRYPHIFLSYLKTAVSRKWQGEQIIDAVEPELVDEAFTQLAAVLSAWSTPLVIVLDNFQEIDQHEEIKKMLIGLINESSPAITFIIASRIRPNLPLTTWKIQNQLAELETKDLAFTKNEIVQFFSHLHGLDLQAYEIDLIYNKTEGWVTSLQLLPGLIKEMDGSERASFWIKFNGTPDIHNYLGSEIMAHQPERVRTFLYQTCLLDHLNPNIINDYLKINDALEIIDHLLHNHLFIYRDKDGTVKYHNLFRSFLYKELLKRHSQVEIDAFHDRLSATYAGRGHLINAFAHALLAGNSLRAVQLMGSMKKRFTPSQFLTLVNKLSEYFSADYSMTTLSLFLFKCIPLYVLKDLIEPLELNLKHLEENNNPIFQAYFRHQLAVIYFYLGELDQADKLCNLSLRACSEMKDHEMVVKNQALKTLLGWRMGNYESAVQFAQQILSYPGSVTNFHTHQLALWVLSEIHLAMNDLDKAKSLIDETLKLSEHRSDSSIIFPYLASAKYYRLAGDLKQALKWITKAEEIAVQYNWTYDLGLILIEKAMIFLGKNQVDEAESCLNQALECLKHNVYFASKIKQMQIRLWKKSGQYHLVLSTEKQLEKMFAEKSFCWYFPPEIIHRVGPVLVKERDQAKLKVYTLGPFEMKYGESKVTVKRKTSMRILQYLIANYSSKTKLTKDHLIDTLFSDSPLKSAYNQFYVSLSHLRKALEPDLRIGRDSSFVKQTNEHYYLCLDHLYLDVEEFSTLIEYAGDAPESERIDYLKKAVQLYRGDFFEEYPYDSFLEAEREKLRVFYLKALFQIACFYWAKTDYHKGMEYFEKCLNKDPYQEQVYEAYIEKLLEAGFLLQAKRMAGKYEQFVEKELGIPVQTNLQKLFNKFSPRFNYQRR